jgi:hypothetical protein
MVDFGRIIAELEAIRRTPSIYVQPVTSESLLNHLTGFQQGVIFAQSETKLVDFAESASQAVLDRGWTSPSNVVGEMRSKRLSDAQIFEEVLSIVIDQYRILSKRQNERTHES